jgi:CubicO group peptidase (beta-lactamase class C family)
LVARLVAEGRVSAAAALIGSAERVELEASAGMPGEGSDGKEGSRRLFDLASLTKPCMATLALRLDQAGRLPLDLTVGDVWPRAAERLRRRSLDDLLRHRAGFQPWTPLYRRCRRPQTVARLLLKGELLGARAGTYSDLDYVLWGLTAERVLGERLGRALQVFLTDPLGTRLLKTSPGPSPQVMSCGLDNARERALATEQGLSVASAPAPPLGMPQDGNARFLGGLGGHAGLFGSARSLWRLAREWLRPGWVLEAQRVDAALQGPGRWLLGWSRRQVKGDAGPALSAASFGHTGFTGGSLWIDPEAERILILLAHRTSVDVDLAPWRRRFHRLALSLL